MKEKTNLELFKNEIIYNMEQGKYDTLYVAMVDIYNRENCDGNINYADVLDWFSDVPRETLKLEAYSYYLINEYYSVLQEEAIIDVDSKPIEWYTMFKTLIRMHIIPSRYSQMQLKDFMKIIRLKEVKK